MKHVIFTLLKAIEIAALVFVPYWVGCLASLFVYTPEPVYQRWGCGMLVVMIGFGFSMVLWALGSIFVPWWIEANKEWSARIADKIKKESN